MVFNLLNASIIAAMAIRIAPIVNTVIAMSTIQSSSPDIERAATQQTYLFVAYVSLLLLTLVGTVLLYRAGNRYQDAVKRDADARIAEARSSAAQANERAGEANDGAGKANERAQKLEHDNLTLRNDLNSESGKVAGLQKAASDALAEQQRVQTELSAQQGRTANLEKEAADANVKYLQLLKQVSPRTLTAEQRKELLKILKANPKGGAGVWGLTGIPETLIFAEEIATVFRDAGWQVNFNDFFQIGGGRLPDGLIVDARSDDNPLAIVVRQAFETIGLSVQRKTDLALSENEVRITVGTKPR